MVSSDIAAIWFLAFLYTNYKMFVSNSHIEIIMLHPTSMLLLHSNRSF